MIPIIDIHVKYEEEIKKASQHLINVCQNKFANKNDIEWIKKGLDVARHAHRNDYRKSGEPYILHPIEVARILAEEIGLGVTTIVSALLHDVVEDNPEEYNLDLIEELFNHKVREIVDAVTKISKVSELEETTQVATIKKLLKNIEAEPRAIFVKIADRLHNLRTLDSMPENKKLIKAAETHFFYAPLAHSFGLTRIRKEMEDLSFKHYHTEDYQKLTEIIHEKDELRDLIFAEFTKQLTSDFDENGILHTFFPEKKSYYKTWKTMQRKSLAFHEVHNYLSVRIVFKNSEVISERSLAFLIFSRITDRYEMQDGSFRDFIKNPHENGFRALVFNVMGARGKWVEVQVMSERMHAIAENGYFSQGFDAEDDKNLPQANWLHQVALQLNDPENDAFNFMENFQDAFIHPKINVYTPKGEIIRLPKDATVLDFAFYVHTDLGLKCKGALVNRRAQGADYVLKNADQVKVMVSEEIKPEEIWLDYVHSAKGKSSLRSFFKKQRKRHVSNGIVIFDEVLGEFGMQRNEKLMTELTKLLYCEQTDDIFCKLSRGVLTKEDVHNAIKQTTPSFKFLNIVIPRIWVIGKNKQIITVEANPFSPKNNFVIDEKINSNYQIAKCCTPIPGDNCIAYKSQQGTVFVHSSSCTNAIQYLASEKNFVTTVEWRKHKYKSFPARMVIRGTDRKGIMADITAIISATHDINMKNVYFKTDGGVFFGVIDLYVTGLDIMNNLLTQIKKVNDIVFVKRVPYIGSITDISHHK